MEALLGFDLDLWDYLTFLTLMLCVVALILTWLFLAGLPGRIAIARKHPEAEAVKYLGYAGLLPTVYPWMQALIWAFKPTDIVDIRRFPREEAHGNREGDCPLARHTRLGPRGGQGVDAGIRRRRASHSPGQDPVQGAEEGKS